MPLVLAFVLVVVASVGACAGPCDDSACLALVRSAAKNKAPIAENEPGIGGVVAYLSDLVVNDCQECTFAQASVSIWPTEETISSEQSAAVHTRSMPPVVSIVADQRYAAPLPPGRYLLCSEAQCINVSVQAARTTTVNIRKIDGLSSFFVREGEAERFVERNGLLLPTETP